MIWMIIVILLFVFIGWILFAPLTIIVDTSQKRYETALRGLLKANIIKHDEEGVKVRIKMLFFRFYLHPFKLINRKGKKIVNNGLNRKRMKKKKDIRFFIFIFKTSWQIIKRTKLKKIHLNIDTGDVVKNAYLIPGFGMLNSSTRKLRVNFENRNELIIHFEHRMYLILWQIIVNFINYKFKNR